MRCVNTSPWTAPFGACPLDNAIYLSSQRLMRFSASRRLASIHSRFSSGFRFSDRSRSSPAFTISPAGVTHAKTCFGRQNYLPV